MVESDQWEASWSLPWTWGLARESSCSPGSGDLWTVEEKGPSSLVWMTLLEDRAVTVRLGEALHRGSASRAVFVSDLAFPRV